MDKMGNKKDLLCIYRHRMELKVANGCCFWHGKKETKNKDKVSCIKTFITLLLKRIVAVIASPKTAPVHNVRSV